MLPLLQGVEPFVQVLVEPPDLPLPQGGAEKQANGSLRPPDGPLTAVHGELANGPLPIGVYAVVGIAVRSGRWLGTREAT